jgi:hypothetical protein
MKFKSIAILLLLLTLCNISQAAQVTFTWDKNTGPEVAGYKLYQGNETRIYNTTVDVKNVTTYTHTIPPDVDLYFALTAYSNNPKFLESDFSDEVFARVDTPVLQKLGTVQNINISVEISP